MNSVHRDNVQNKEGKYRQCNVRLAILFHWLLHYHNETV